MSDPLSDARVNILGTVNLLQLSVKHNVNRFHIPFDVRRILRAPLYAHGRVPSGEAAIGLRYV